MTFFDEQPDGDPHGECALEIHRLEQERDELAAQVEVMRAALHKLACLGNGDTYGNSTGNRIAQDALALPNTAAEILKKRDARVLLDAVDRLKSLERDTASWNNSIRTAISEVQNMADTMENGK